MYSAVNRIWSNIINNKRIKGNFYSNPLNSNNWTGKSIDRGIENKANNKCIPIKMKIILIGYEIKPIIK